MDLAVHDYQEALKLQPAWQEGWWNVGTIEYERDHYAGAIPAFRMLARLAPEASPAWTFLGLCEFGTKDYFYALAHLSKGESLGGARDAQIARVAKYHLGLLLIRSGDFDKATALLSALASTGEVSPQIKFALGLYLLRVPLLPDEIDSSKEALVQDAGDIAAELAAGDLSAAMNAFKIAIAKYPDAPGLHRAFGEALARDGKTKDAQAEFRRETQVSRPAIADRIVQWYGTSPRADRPSTDETSSGGALFDAAMQDYSAKQFPEAIAALKIWLQQNANSGTAWAVLGLSEFAQRDYDNALIHLRRGQQLGMSGSPESVALANYRLGVLLNHSGQFSAAEQLLMPARASEPLGSEIKFALGMSVLHITEFSEQVPASQRALVTGAGEIAALLGDSKYDLAFSRLDELLKKYPSTPFLHYTYGTALGSISQYEEAAKQFREELALSPSSELPYLGLASLELKRHRAADALEPAQRAVQLAPRNSTAHYLLGRSYLETGKTTEALAELRQASAITPNSPEVHFSLAKAYAKANQPEKAEEERTIFAQLNILKERQRGQQGDQSYGAHEATNADISGVDRAGTEAGKPR
jgi:tetratricopeptide (TPR) repeat protein